MKHEHLHNAGTRWGNLRQYTRWEDRTPPPSDPTRTADSEGRNCYNKATGYVLFPQSAMPVGPFRTRTMERVPAVVLLAMGKLDANRECPRCGPVWAFVDRHRAELEERALTETHVLNWSTDFRGIPAMMRLTPEQQAWLADQQAKLPPPPEPQAPKKAKPVYRPVTEDEALAIAALPGISIPPGTFDKRFARDLSGKKEITDGQASQLWRIIYKFRRQLPAASKDRLVKLAEQLQQQS